MRQASAQFSSQDSGREPEKIARRAVVGLGRIGLLARGLLYFLIGGVALAAAGRLDEARGPKGTLIALLAWPGGRIVVGVLALGFLAFALSHAMSLFVERRRTWRAWWRRFVAVCLAITYTSLTLFAANVALFNRQRPRGAPPAAAGGVGVELQDTRGRIGYLLSWPGGYLVLGVIALGFAGFGAYEFWRAFFGSADREIPRARWPLRVLWRVGIAARGAVFLGVGIILMRVAFNGDAREAGGIGAALRALAQHDAARPVLLAVGCGLIAFGIVEAIAAARGAGGPVADAAADSPPSAPPKSPLWP
ncbi:MAG TPA: DUF1206 domain-containing protein [Phycisphaerae bacterium]|nr:DUF1206 domain-containing protein [Phycisphaerae bacterium]